MWTVECRSRWSRWDSKCKPTTCHSPASAFIAAVRIVQTSVQNTRGKYTWLTTLWISLHQRRTHYGGGGKSHLLSTITHLSVWTRMISEGTWRRFIERWQRWALWWWRGKTVRIFKMEQLGTLSAISGKRRLSMCPSLCRLLVWSACFGSFAPSRLIWWLLRRSWWYRGWRNLSTWRWTQSSGTTSRSTYHLSSTYLIESKWTPWGRSLG